MKDFLLGLLPPDLTDPKSMTRWTIAMSAKVYLLAFFTIWAMSFIPGFPGFARAGDVDRLSREIRSTRAEILESSIFNVRVKQCEPDTPLTLRRAYGEQVNKMLRTYYEITGTRYELPDCDEVR